jgi:hypothetical protein
VTDPRLVSIAVLATLFACADDDGGDGRVTEVTETTAVAAPELRAELLAMMEEDQAEMSGQVATDNYRQRTDRQRTDRWPRSSTSTAGRAPTSSARTDQRRRGSSPSTPTWTPSCSSGPWSCCGRRHRKGRRAAVIWRTSRTGSPSPPARTSGTGPRSAVRRAAPWSPRPRSPTRRTSTSAGPTPASPARRALRRDRRDVCRRRLKNSWNRECHRCGFSVVWPADAPP